MKNKFILCCLVVLVNSCSSIRMDMPPVLPEPERLKVSDVSRVQDMSIKKIVRVELLSALSVASWGGDADIRWKDFKMPAGNLELSADGMPLNEFIHMALGDVLGLNFEVDAAVATQKDKVTLHVSKPVPAKRLLGLIEQVLDVYGVGLVSDSVGLRVVPKSAMGETIPSVVSSVAKLDLLHGRVMMIIPFTYAKPGEALIFARHFLQMGKIAQVSLMQRLNALLVIGMPDRVRRLKQAVEMIDRPAMAHRSVALVKPVYWKVTELMEPIKQGLRSQGVPLASNAGEKGLYLMPIEQINAMMVVSPNKKWLKLLESWVTKLDTVDAVGESDRLFVYFVRQSDAKSLGAVLTAVLGGSSVTQSKKPTEKVAKVTAKAGALTVGKAGRLRVVIDQQHNALVFIGSARAYRVAHQLLQQLDIPAKQVLIEATVADISLDESTQLGVEWQFSNVDRSNVLHGVLGTLGGLGVGGAGLSYTLLNSAGSVRAKLNALASMGKAKILSSPRLLAKDNEKARIQVGTQVAVLSQEVTNATAVSGANTGLLRSFVYVDTGVILTFTPTITADGAVQLKISQEVSEAGASTNNTPPIFKRNVETTLVAQSGQSILIGGLITHNEGKQVSKVPLLGDIPWLGQFFSSTSVTDRSTEMVVLITPHVITSSADADFFTRAFQDMLSKDNESWR